MSDNFVGDAIERIWIIENLPENWSSLLYGTWGSVFYIIFLPLIFLFNDIEIGTRFLSVFFNVSALAVLTFYIKSIYGGRIALIMAILGGIHPLGVYMSSLTFAGNPFSLFLISGLFAVHKSIELKSKKWAIIGGLFFTLASGIRFENWFITLFIATFFFYNKEWKGGLLFIVFSFIFPVFWMISSYVNLGDPFLSFTGSKESVTIYESLEYPILMERLWDYLVKSSGYLVRSFIILSIGGMFLVPKRKEKVALYLLFFFYLCMHLGGICLNIMNTQRRYLFIPHLLLLPYAAIFIDHLKNFRFKEFRRPLKTILYLGIVILAIYFFKLNEFKYLAKTDLAHKKWITKLNKINKNESSVMLDGMNHNHWYIAQNLNVPKKSIFLAPGAINLKLDPMKAKKFIQDKKPKFILVDKNPASSKFLPYWDYKTGKIFNVECFIVEQDEKRILIELFSDQ